MEGFILIIVLAAVAGVLYLIQKDTRAMSECLSRIEKRLTEISHIVNEHKNQS
jgi:hypothetical protein